MPKKCEGQGAGANPCTKFASFGLSDQRVKRWCGVCGKAHGAIALQAQKSCEDCDQTKAHYGMPGEGKRKWCGKCGKTRGAVLIGANMCGECGVKQANFGLPGERKKQWCGGCGKAHGAVFIYPERMSKQVRLVPLHCPCGAFRLPPFAALFAWFLASHLEELG